MSLLLRHPDQPDNPKVLKVAVIGAPNAGKSTLSNQLLGIKVFVSSVLLLNPHTWRSLCKANNYLFKVFAVSKKVHTTRSRAMGVLTEDDTQIVRAFLCLFWYNTTTIIYKYKYIYTLLN